MRLVGVISTPPMGCKGLSVYGRPLILIKTGVKDLIIVSYYPINNMK